MNPTKKKILKVASELFAGRGYNGTSVRDIASGAEVNLAAINYHFKNKQNLYCEVFDDNCQWLEEGIAQLGQEAKDISDFVWKLYQFFMSNSSYLLNAFKMLLSDNVPIPEDHFDGESLEEFGPPGGNILKKLILEQVKQKDLPEEAYNWAVSVIFNQVVHIAIMMSSSLIRKKCEKMASFGDQLIKRRLCLLAEAVLNQLEQEEVSTKFA